MITTDMRTYSLYGVKTDGYGSSNPDFTNPIAYIKMAVYVTDYDTQQNSAFGGSAYVGLTLDRRPTRELIGNFIDIGEKYLAEISYVYTRGRYVQIFMQESRYGSPSYMA